MQSNPHCSVSSRKTSRKAKLQQRGDKLPQVKSSVICVFSAYAVHGETNNIPLRLRYIIFICIVLSLANLCRIMLPFWLKRARSYILFLSVRSPLRFVGFHAKNHHNLFGHDYFKTSVNPLELNSLVILLHFLNVKDWISVLIGCPVLVIIQNAFLVTPTWMDRAKLL